MELYQESGTTLNRIGIEESLKREVSDGITQVPVITLDQPCYVYGNVMSLCSPMGSFATNTTIPAVSQFACLLSRGVKVEVGELPFFSLTPGYNTNVYFHDDLKLLLPATTLAGGCYGSMFNGCINLTKGPDLPAETAVDYCYHMMFNKCSSLKEISCNLRYNIGDAFDSSSVSDGSMTFGCPPNGVFKKNPAVSEATWRGFENAVVPTGWTFGTYGQ